MRRRARAPFGMNAQNRQASSLTVSALLDVLLDVLLESEASWWDGSAGPSTVEPLHLPGDGSAHWAPEQVGNQQQQGRLGLGRHHHR